MINNKMMLSWWCGDIMFARCWCIWWWWWCGSDDIDGDMMWCRWYRYDAIMPGRWYWQIKDGGDGMLRQVIRWYMQMVVAWWHTHTVCIIIEDGRYRWMVYWLMVVMTMRIWWWHIWTASGDDMMVVVVTWYIAVSDEDKMIITGWWWW